MVDNATIANITDQVSEATSKTFVYIMAKIGDVVSVLSIKTIKYLSSQGVKTSITTGKLLTIFIFIFFIWIFLVALKFPQKIIRFVLAFILILLIITIIISFFVPVT